jgi:o-succinylbenzoate---CoA ligase
MLALLAAALDGSGPAILPLDPELPPGVLSAALEAFAPAAIETTEGTRPAPLAAVAGSGRLRRLEPAAAEPAGLESAGLESAGLGPAGVVDADTAVVMATSGTTGVPKGVQLSAAALAASAAASLGRIGAAPGERWLCCLPTFHIAGLGVLVRSLLTGTAPVITRSVSAEVISECGCSYVSLVPTQLRRLVAASATPGPVRTVLLGGAATPDDLLTEARARGWQITTTYGMSETCGGCVYDGMPLDGVSVRTGADGQIRIAGPVLFSGYRRRPDLTAAALDDGWFITSDLGEVSDGRVIIRGRADQVINSGGEKIVPADVEALLTASDDIADAAVVGVPDPEWGEAVTAFVIPVDPGDPPDLERLKSIVRERLSARAVPKRMLVMPEFPLLPSGKPDRGALRELGLSAGQSSVRPAR